jgi:hypothetical protein
LNLAKCLEVLFPPSKKVETIDSTRSGLRAWGYSDDQIERDFIPAIALRNKVDVGHAQLGLFSMEQLKVIRAYTDRAEDAFREMLNDLLARLELGEAQVEGYEPGPADQDAQKVIDRLKQKMAGLNKQ